MRPLPTFALLLASALALAAVAGCGSTRSTVTIDAGERFELGGGQGGAFRVEMRNVGPEPVGISARGGDGEVADLGVLAPGEERSVDVPAGSTALLSNRSGQEARVAVEIRGGGTLGMGYVDVD